jgi:nicotinamide phosphoribosyltransferase
MYLERYERTLTRLKEMGYSACNLVIGVGGILRNHSRDTLGFAIKATYVEINGESREIEKDPITDTKKKSHKGLLGLYLDDDLKYVTHDQCSVAQSEGGLLNVVFRDGIILKEETFEAIRGRVMHNTFI